MTMETLKKSWNNEYVQTGIMILIIIVVVFGFWYGTQIILKTQYPALAVASGSMCRERLRCDGWSHPFEPTLHVGDLIIVQGVPPEDIKAAEYPDGDIIVFRSVRATRDLIVHRAVAKVEKEGEWFFQTQGDGNTGPDYHTPNIPEENVEGKVVMRIPWIGHIALFMRNSSGIYIIAFLIVLLVVVEFVIPIISSRKKEVRQEEDIGRTSETEEFSAPESSGKRLNCISAGKIIGQSMKSCKVIQRMRKTIRRILPCPFCVGEDVDASSRGSVYCYIRLLERTPKLYHLIGKLNRYF